MAKIPISIKDGTIIDDSEELIIGIDLGTTNSLVAYTQDNVPSVIKHNDQSGLVPSIVHFAEAGEVVVGESAKDLLLSKPERTIYSAKRLMGKSYNDVAAMQQMLAYRIIENNEEELVKVAMGDHYFTPIELSAKILEALKNRVELALRRKVSKAVITVPAYFNDAQRQATRDAGKIAGLEVLRIVNEPTAASLAYGLGLGEEMDKVIAVYDLGGGTFDISILNLQSGVFEVLSTNGDTFLGGDDFDKMIMEYWTEKHPTIFTDLQNDKEKFQALRIHAEEAKKALSSQDHSTTQYKDTQLEISKTDFEQLIQPLIHRTIQACEKALADSQLRKKEIDEVIMVGGSTRVPAVKSAVASFFNQEVNDKINPDEVVALGAAVQADILAGNQKGILLLDITPLSLGIETMGGLMDTIIPRNSKVPHKASRQYTTSVDGQANLKITIYQGERDLVEHNRKLGEFVLNGIPGMPAGLPKVEVSFMLDADGILLVNAKELRSDTETSLQIKSQYGISEEEMGKMLLDSISNAKEDMQTRAILEARNEGNSMLRSVSKFLKDNRAYLEAEQIQKIEELQAELKKNVEGSDKDLILKGIETLNTYTEPLANEAFTRIVRKELTKS